MKKFLFIILCMIMIMSLGACKKEENNPGGSSVDNNQGENVTAEYDKNLIKSVYGNDVAIQIGETEKSENVEDFLMDIDSNGINELVRLTYEYMVDHLHIYKLVDDNPYEYAKDDYFPNVCSLYVTKDGVYAATAEADGQCYEDLKLIKINLANDLITQDVVLEVTCDQEAEIAKRNIINEKLQNCEISEDEAENESINAHTLQYLVNGNVVSKQEFDAKIAELNKTVVKRKVAHINDVFEKLWIE